MEISIKVSGKMTKLTVKGFIDTWMELFMKVNGEKTNSMARERNHGQTKPCMKVITQRDRSTVREGLPGRITQAIRVNLSTIIFADTAFTNGLTIAATKASGKIIKCTEMEYSSGQIAEFTRVNTSKTRRKERVYSLGQMAESTKVLGKPASSMEKELSLIDKGSRRSESGLMASEFGGTTIVEIESAQKNEKARRTSSQIIRDNN